MNHLKISNEEIINEILKEAVVIKGKQDGTKEERLKFFQKNLGTSFKEKNDYLEFSKRGGYIDSLKKKTIQKLELLGFKRITSDNTMGQSEIANVQLIMQDNFNNEAVFSSMFGATASTNSHAITIKFGV